MGFEVINTYGINRRKTSWTGMAMVPGQNIVGEHKYGETDEIPATSCVAVSTAI